MIYHTAKGLPVCHLAVLIISLRPKPSVDHVGIRFVCFKMQEEWTVLVQFHCRLPEGCLCFFVVLEGTSLLVWLVIYGRASSKPQVISFLFSKCKSVAQWFWVGLNTSEFMDAYISKAGSFRNYCPAVWCEICSEQIPRPNGHRIRRNYTCSTRKVHATGWCCPDNMMILCKWSKMKVEYLI